MDRTTCTGNLYGQNRGLGQPDPTFNEFACTLPSIPFPEDTVTRLNHAIKNCGQSANLDAQTWLKAALTNLETCRTSRTELDVKEYRPLLSNNVNKVTLKKTTPHINRTCKEKVVIGHKGKNITMAGDGIGKTIATGSDSKNGGYTTFKPATFGSYSVQRGRPFGNGGQWRATQGCLQLSILLHPCFCSPTSSPSIKSKIMETKGSAGARIRQPPKNSQ
ncbi:PECTINESTERASE [Salix purpurea]|uniref:PECTINESTERASE n=1 Tax=Salix purpurea TaxID=77065 RepID=A0A9Q0TIF5_SALPP|nr:PECTINESTERASE [Salix purpurea]